MKSKTYKTILASSILALAFTACTKTGATGPAGATGGTGPALSGTLEGYVDLFDSYGDLMTPSTGVYITIPTKAGTDSTSTSGMFTKSLTTGTYELDFAKTGYGAVKIVSLNFAGGGMQYIGAHIQMTQVPAYSLTSVVSGTATVGGLSAVSLTVTPSSTDTKARKVICFFNSVSTVSYLPANYTGSTVINIPANAVTGSGSISTAAAYGAGIGSGATIYISAYPISVSNTASAYADVTTGKNIYNNINTASTVSTSTIVP